MLRIGISGAAGKMGRAVSAVVGRSKGCSVGLLLERKGHDMIGSEIGGVRITDDLKSGLGSFDVFVDFTAPQASLEFIKVLAEAGRPMVLATTGFKKAELELIDEAAKKIPVVFASNYSVGVNVMWKLLKEATRLMKEDYDIDIVESHHRYKKDAPSGTAVTCAQVILAEKGLDYDSNVVFGREGRENDRPRNQIGMLSVRGGGVVGEHTVIYASDEDRIEIKHTAFSRESLAAGSLKAARFLTGKKPGLYSMSDVLGI
jgi:4-hydroxy-tetrahydrodipicolinate reductase